MQEIAEIIKIYRDLVTDNLFISLLIVKLLSYFYSKEVYKISKEIIRWGIISGGVINILSWLACAVFTDDLLPGAIGPNATTFWWLIFFTCLLPLTLLLNKIKHNGWAILLVALLVNLGGHVEWQVFLGMSGNGWVMGLSFTPLITLFAYGILLAIFITGISLVVMKYRKNNTNDIKAL